MWEAQAQDGIGQAERLKDLLEESALWRVPNSAAQLLSQILWRAHVKSLTCG